MAEHEVEKKMMNGGRYVFREHEAGDMAFVVESGEVEIVKANDAGDITVLATVGRGGMFGEMALIDDKPRMASARCKGDVSLIVVSRDMFKKKLEGTDRFIKALLNILSDHIRRTSG